jgi:predicted enzyme related to lactoylglutathione lyase
MMKHPDSLLLYVRDTAKTADFFHRLFEIPVVQQSVNFAMLAAPNGWALGLWAQHDVKPAPQAVAGGVELMVTLETEAAVDDALTQAQALNAPVLQAPVHLDFGYTFLVQSPDGHFIRVFKPSE